MIVIDISHRLRKIPSEAIQRYQLIESLMVAGYCDDDIHLMMYGWETYE